MGWASVALGATAAALGFFGWLGALKKMKIYDAKFPGGYFIYKDLACPVHKLGEPFAKVHQLKKEFFKAEGYVINESPSMGIYYDDPDNIVDPSGMRVSVGFLIPFADEKLFTFFEEKGYSVANLPASDSVCGVFPRKVDLLSFVIAPMKYYPNAMAHIEKNKDKYKD